MVTAFAILAMFFIWVGIWPPQVPLWVRWSVGCWSFQIFTLSVFLDVYTAFMDHGTWCFLKAMANSFQTKLKMKMIIWIDRWFLSGPPCVFNCVALTHDPQGQPLEEQHLSMESIWWGTSGFATFAGELCFYCRTSFNLVPKYKVKYDTPLTSTGRATFCEQFSFLPQTSTFWQHKRAPGQTFVR